MMQIIFGLLKDAGDSSLYLFLGEQYGDIFKKNETL
jgi:hypothetical protein